MDDECVNIYLECPYQHVYREDRHARNKICSGCGVGGEYSTNESMTALATCMCARTTASVM